MTEIKDHFQEYVSDPGRRRIYEREALAFEASELISQLMEEQNISKTDLAARVGTSKSHVTNLLSGSRNMTLHTLADLTFVLGHKVEIKASPLNVVTCWFDAGEQDPDAHSERWTVHEGEQYRDPYSEGWTVRAGVYKPAKSADSTRRPRGGCVEENELYAVA